MNKDISELELLGHFIVNIAVSMRTGEYVVIPRKIKASKTFDSSKNRQSST